MKKHAYTISFVSFVLLSIITFSPIVIPEKYFHPYILGMPRTLGAGIIISFLMAIVVLFSAKFLPTNSGSKNKDEVDS